MSVELGLEHLDLGDRVGFLGALGCDHLFRGAVDELLVAELLADDVEALLVFEVLADFVLLGFEVDSTPTGMKNSWVSTKPKAPVTFSLTLHASDVAQVADHAFQIGGVGLAFGVDDDLQVEGLLVGNVSLLADAAHLGHDAGGLVEVGEELPVDGVTRTRWKGDEHSSVPRAAPEAGCKLPR